MIPVPVGRTGDLAYVKWNTALRLRIHHISEDQMRLLPEPLQAEIRAGTIELESLLALGSRARLRVVVTAAHTYTFGRSVAIHRFSAESIRSGPFEIRGERMREDELLTGEGEDEGDVSESPPNPVLATEAKHEINPHEEKQEMNAASTSQD